MNTYTTFEEAEDLLSDLAYSKAKEECLLYDSKDVVYVYPCIIDEIYYEFVSWFSFKDYTIQDFHFKLNKI